MPAAPLPPYLARRLADGLTYVTRRDLASAGIDVSTLRAWRRAGFVTPYSYGAYGIVDPCAADMDHFAARRLHHVRRCEALLQTLPGAHLIGGSALVVHRLAVLRFPDRIEVARRPRVQSRRDDFVCRRAWGEAPEQVDGLGAQHFGGGNGIFAAAGVYQERRGSHAIFNNLQSEWIVVNNQAAQRSSSFSHKVKGTSQPEKR